MNDTWVAACCIANEVPLLTYNRDDFEGVPVRHRTKGLPDLHNEAPTPDPRGPEPDIGLGW